MGFPIVFQPGWAEKPAPAGDTPSSDAGQAPTVDTVKADKPKRRSSKSSGQDTPES